MEEYKGKNRNRKPKKTEDPDSLKVRLNRLIKLAEILVWLVSIGCAVLFGLFVRVLLI